ncbi:hypothetical protein acsn021_07730 [Anaerocolumna cellulosilytica]|uniref:Uncharacterized protein n=1 Tax=Anaerocolumna cellulosilytica TaxID=433286 RepID=A0A6S6QRG9_9FIRM|nr:amino acid adenylation domain-containing protein [Anaerocolumna cellulosilytica]MBB5197629.1 amino acid adenylation domain-containing protein [Anaerocolumna cellulosilytica]BCJ93204.1 hypothetical protein acsn021_07730 [Anaerocolumna cellulosilytica]
MHTKEYFKLGISGVFQMAVEKYKNQPAVTGLSGTMTYKELDDMSSRLASRLLRLDGWSEDIVTAVDVSKDNGAIILLLAIYKAHGIFLPIPRSCPQKRLVSMTEQGEAKILITDSAERAESIVQYIQTVYLQDIMKDLSKEEPYKSALEDKRGEALAYIIFTSGSTGKPKGIMVSQQSVVHIAYTCYSRFFGLSEEAEFEQLQGLTKEYLKMGVLSDFSFDPSVVQIYMALFFGHCIVLITEEIKRSQWELSNYWRKYQVDVCEITPTHLKHILQYFNKRDEELYLPQIIISVGEPLPLKLLKDVFGLGKIGVKKVINAYGPTEVCVYSHARVYSYEEVDYINEISIGRPLKGYEVYLLNHKKEDVKEGEVGEIYIHSPYLSLGYINNEDMTKKTFLKVHNSDHRMYKTNDLGIIKKDGEYLCLGRSDDQIKIRGHRIELGEIENVLKEYGDFSDIRVLAKEDDNQQKHIIAFYLGEGKDEKELKGTFKNYLPEYMIPNRFIRLNHIPINANGKINRQELLQMIEVNSSLPLIRTKQSLVEICREIIKCNTLTGTDNFFDNGATSLEVFILNTRVFHEWGVVLENKDIYQSETIWQIQKLIEDKLLISKENYGETSENLADSEMVKATEFQCKIIRSENRVYKNRKLEDSNKTSEMPPYNVVYKITHSQYIDNEKLENAIDKMIKRHRILRSSFLVKDGVVYIRAEKEGKIDFSYLMVENINKLDLSAYTHEFRFNSLPLFQIVLFEDRQREQEIVLNLHHGIFDYLSLSVFINELFRLYYQIPMKLPDSDFFEYRKQYIQADKTRLNEFWKQYMRNRPLSVGFQGNGENQRLKVKKQEKFKCLQRNYDVTVMNTMKELCIREKISMFTLTSVILAQILSDWENQQEFCIGTILHGRMSNVPGVSSMIGLFAELMPLRYIIYTNESLRTKLQRHQKYLEDVLEHQGLGMNELYMLQDYEERFKGDYFKLIINYHTDFSCNLPNGMGFVIAEEIGQYPEEVPLYIQIREYKDGINFHLIYAASIYKKEDIERIMNDYSNCLTNWIEILQTEPQDRKTV